MCRASLVSVLHVFGYETLLSVRVYNPLVFALARAAALHRRAQRCRRHEEAVMAEPAAPPNEDVRAALVKLKGQAQEWTMSEDAKLEACMAAIQSRLEQRSGRLERRLAEFGLDLERTHAKLGNVFNEFDGLSHSQVPSAQPHRNP